MRLGIETTAVHQDDCADHSLAGAKAVSKYPTKRDAAPCFATGTKLITLTGEKPVEEIAVGDKVLTADNGFKPVAWTGRRTMTADDLEMYPQLRPIRIAEGVFGNSRPLTVSPQHGLIIRHNGTEQLVRAHQIADMFGPQAAQVDKDVASVTYHHLMFDQHELVFAEGALTEAFFPGPNAIASLDQDARAELFLIFPELEKILSDGVLPRDVFGRAARRYLAETPATVAAANSLAA